MAISREDRARQFLPFAALEGFEEEIKKKEILIEEKKELSDERKQEISKILNRIEEGTIIRIKHYSNNKYVKTVEKVKKIDAVKEKIILENNERIDFDNIFNIEIL